MTERNKSRSVDIFFQLTKRHLLVFFKNKVRLFYTLLVPVIIFLVYIIFLRGMELMMVENTLRDLEITADDTMTRYIKTLVDTWMLSGIMALTTITVSLQTNTVFVEDKQNGVNRDFASSPIHRNILIGSYFLFNFIVTLIICLTFLIVCLVYLACMGEFLISAAAVFTVIACIFYTTVSATLMTVFISSFVKTEGTMASLVAVFSTAVGFLIGAYMPLGMLPAGVGNLCGFIPGTYSCYLLRYAFMHEPFGELSVYAIETLHLENGAQLLTQINSTFGFDLSFFGVSVSPQWQCLAIAVFIVIFLLLNIGFGKKLAVVLGVGKKKKVKNRVL